MGVMKEAGKNVLSGVVIGASMLLPGVSGGTTAIMLGIYDHLIGAVSGVRRKPKKSLLLLSQVAFGGIAGVLLLAKVVLRATEIFYFPMRCLFMGLILGSVPMLVKKAGVTVRKLPLLLFGVLGMGTAVGLGMLPPLQAGRIGGFGLFLCGLLIAAALVLPGISTSHLLLALGMYEPVLEAVSRMDLPFLGLLASGTLVGIFLCAKLLEKAMQRFPTACYLLITGFVLASVYELHPGVPTGADVLPSLLTFATGFSGMVMITSFHETKQAAKKVKIGL